MRAPDTPLTLARYAVHDRDASPAGRRPPLVLLPSPEPPRDRRARIILADFLVTLGVAALAIFLLWSMLAPGSPAALRSTGTVASVHITDGGWLVVRMPSHSMVHVPIAGKRLLSRDGERLEVSNLRGGDAVVVRPNTVVDLSQARASVQGIVASPPDPDGDVMTLQVTPARMMLVAIGPNTRISGEAPTALSRMSIKVADQIRVVGVVDTTLDEMTQTWTIDTVSIARRA